MTIRPRLMIGAGIAFAGLGLIGAGAGATFTAQVSTRTSISSGGIGFSLNGKTGSALDIGLNGRNISSHFNPMATDLALKNTGTLTMASTYLSLTATGCDGSAGASLAKALKIELTDATNKALIYDGPLCSFATGIDKNSAGDSPSHSGVGSRLPRSLKAGEVIGYRLVIQPDDARQGLPTAAQYTNTTVNLVFTGFDY